jgi:formylglycine-generating enzyme required for sulfatase activity
MGKFALLIGVGEYQSSELQNLEAAILDVKAIEQVLVDPAIADFAQSDVVVLLNPDSQEMREAIERLFIDRRKDDLVLLYFSGHAMVDDSGKFHLASARTNKRMLNSTAIPATFVHGLMEGSRSHRQVLILDSCFSGAFAKGMRAKGEAVNLQTQLGGKGKAVLTSASATNYSFEQAESGLSIYTRYLVEGLRTGRADLDEDGWISVGELHEFVKRKVQEVVPAMQPKIYAMEEGYRILLAKAILPSPSLNSQLPIDPTPDFQLTIDRYTATIHYFTEDLGENVTLDMVLISSGSFEMGSPENELERQENEGPQHTVNVPTFFMGSTSVTQAQWRSISQLPKVKIDLKINPSEYKGYERPVEMVSWDDAIEFCARLSKLTGRKYRLPTEAEWEYACRAGTTTPFSFGETIDSEVANYQAEDEEIGETVYPGKYGQGRFGKYHGETTPVKTFHANKWGLYDMHGNVCEWCQDESPNSYVDSPRDAGTRENSQDTYHIIRGGSWSHYPGACRSAYRLPKEDTSRFNIIGFRVVCDTPLL